MNQSYIICCTPPSGSTLLCDLLSASSLAGHPNSFFSNPFYSEWAEFFGLSCSGWSTPVNFDKAYVDAVIRQGCGKTDTFGMRIQGESLFDFTRRLHCLFSGFENDKALFESVFNTQHYIYLYREDRLSQAVSLLRAEQSGLWHVNADGTERERLKQSDTIQYDAKGITSNLDSLDRQNEMWQNWFKEQMITPTFISYEQLTGNPEEHLKRVLEDLGLQCHGIKHLKPKTASLSDAMSRNWVDRYRVEESCHKMGLRNNLSLFNIA